MSCRCFLPQFKSRKDPPSHKFLVFSVADDDVVIPKIVQCNNCGAVHRVTGICESKLLGKDSSDSIVSIQDVSASLPKNLVDILERHSCPLPAWEKALFILEEQRWGDYVVLASEDDGGSKTIKYVRIMSPTFFKIDQHERQVVVQESTS